MSIWIFMASVVAGAVVQILVLLLGYHLGRRDGFVVGKCEGRAEGWADAQHLGFEAISFKKGLREGYEAGRMDRKGKYRPLFVPSPSIRPWKSALDSLREYFR